MQNQNKISVDSFEKEGDVLTCYCYIAWQSEKEMEAEPNRIVTMEELKAHVADGKGNVYISSAGDDGEYIPFEEWFEGNEKDMCMEWELEEVINKREGRKEIGNWPDIFAAMGKVFEPAA